MKSENYNKNDQTLNDSKFTEQKSHTKEKTNR